MSIKINQKKKKNVYLNKRPEPRNHNFKCRRNKRKPELRREIRITYERRPTYRFTPNPSDVHINGPSAASDVELNSWALNCLECYQLRPTLVVHMMLEVLRNEFQGWGYTEFSKLDQHIRETLKETFMAKGIYMGTPSDHVNQRLAKLIIDEQLPAWDEKDLRMYKKMYPTSKAWLFFSNVPVPSLDRSFTQKYSPGNSSLQKWQLSGESEENSACRRDVRPRTQSVGRSYHEERHDTQIPANKNRSTYSLRQQPTHANEQSKASTHQPTVNGEDLEYTHAAEIPHTQTEQWLTLSVEANIKPIDNGKQQPFIPKPARQYNHPYQCS